MRRTICWERLIGLVLAPIAFWIALFWAPIWTGLLLLVCFSVMALAAAWERHSIAQERREEARELTPAEIDEIDAAIIHHTAPWPHG